MRVRRKRARVGEWESGTVGQWDSRTVGQWDSGREIERER